MANTQIVNQIISYGLQNKKKKQEIYSALLNAGVADPTSTAGYVKNLEDQGMFNYESQQDQGVDLKKQYQDALKFALDNKNSDDDATKTRSNQFLMDVENKKILPNGMKIKDDVAAAILQNPQTYHDTMVNMSMPDKTRVNEELAKAGFTVPRKLNSTEKQAQLNAESGIASVNDMRSQIFGNNGELDRNKLVKEALPFAIGAQELRRMKNDAKDILTRIRTGAALNESEVSFYSQLVPSATDTKESAKYKLDQLEAFYSGLAGSEINLKNSTGKVIKYDDMFDPRQRAEVRVALKNGFEFYQPNDFNTVYGKVVVEGDPALKNEQQSNQNDNQPITQGNTNQNNQPKGQPTDTIGTLGKVGQGLGSFLGGNKIGEAIGNVIGGQMAKHGEAGETFKKTIAQIEQMFQEGKIDETKRNQLLDVQEQVAKDAFGYSGPGFRQLVADAGKIALTVLGGAELKGATALGTAAKVGAWGAGQGALNAQAEGAGLGETVGQAAIGAATSGLMLGGGKVIGKAFNVLSGKNAIQNFTTDVAKAIGVTGKLTPKTANQTIPKAVNALSSIAEESKDLIVKDFDGVEKVFNPKKATFGETLQALVHSKNNIYKRYSDLATKAGETGSKFTSDDFNKVVKGLQKMAEGSTSATKSKVNSVIKDITDNFLEKGEADFGQIQKFVEALNKDVNPLSDKAGAEVSGKASQLFRDILDGKINSATGAEYQLLRNKYADIKSIENSLVNQFKKSSRDIGKGLGNWIEGIGGIDAVVGVLTGNPGQVLKGTGISTFAKVMNYLRNPETKLQKAFSVIEKQAAKEGSYGKLSDKITSLLTPAEAGKLETGIRDFNRSAISKIKNIRPGLSIEDVSKNGGAKYQKEINKYSAYLKEQGAKRMMEDAKIKSILSNKNISKERAVEELIKMFGRTK